MRRAATGSVFLLVTALLMPGCGGSAGRAAGDVEGFVYVPQGRAVELHVSLGQSRSAPVGYVALVGAQVTVTSQGVAKTGVTDSTGHFVIKGVPAGKAGLHVVDPSGVNAPFDSEVEVKGDTTISVGTGGQISLVSHSASSLNLSIDQIDTTKWPEVTALISVTDPVRQTAIIGLNKGHFAFKVNGQSVDEAKFSVSQKPDPTVLPAAVVLIQDCSGSMEGQPFIDAQESLKQVVANLAGNDQAELIGFSDSVAVAQGFTSDKSDLNRAVDGLSSGASTALYDAIKQGLGDLATRPEKNKAVVVMTDGGENASSTSHDDLFSTIRSSQIPIYTVGLGGSGFSRKAEVRDAHRGTSKRAAEIDLQDIASQSGGEYFFAATSTDLLGIYTKITARRQQHYVVTFHVIGSGQFALDAVCTAFSLVGRANRSFSAREEALYAPWKRGDSWVCTQGNDAQPTHKKDLKFGWDFQNGRAGNYPFYAAKSGKVADIVPADTSTVGWGTTIVVDHGDGTWARYAHAVPGSLKKSKRGDPVRQGEELGLVGNTGSATGFHLHFQIQASERGPSIAAEFADIGNPPDPPDLNHVVSYKSQNPGTP